MRTHLLRCCLFFAVLSPITAQNLRWHHQFYSKESSRDMLSALDPEANFYTSGYIGGPSEVGPVLGNYLINPDKGQYLYKVDSTGHPVWAKMILRGNGNVKVQSLESDSSGNVFVAGFFTGAVDFDPGPANNTVNTLVERMYFLQKLDTAGNLIWAKQFDTGNPNGFENITTLDPEGNVLVAGIFYKTVDFDPGPGNYTLSITAPGYAGFFLKLDNAGNFLWVKQIDYLNFISTIRSDPENNWIICGQAYLQTDVDTGPDTLYQDYGNFILKLNKQGEFEWVRSYPNNPPKISVDTDGNIFMVGTFKDTVDFDPGPGEAIYMAFNGFSALNGKQAYIMKWNSAGAFQWVRLDPETTEGAVVSVVVAPGPNKSVSVLGYHNGHINIDPDLGPYWLNAGLSNVGLIIQTLDSAGQRQGEMHVSYLNDVFNKREYFLRYDAKGDLYVRTTISGSIAFDIDTSNIQYFDAQAPFNETAQLLFKITAPDVPLVSGSSAPLDPAGVLFPNPGSAYSPLFIDLPEAARLGAPLEIYLWDAKGVLVHQYQGKVGTDIVRLPGLPPGKYAVQIKAGNAVASSWWVIE